MASVSLAMYNYACTVKNGEFGLLLCGVNSDCFCLALWCRDRDVVPGSTDPVADPGGGNRGNCPPPPPPPPPFHIFH